MKKSLFLIAIGVCLGYTIGFSDARTNDRNILRRLVDRVGGLTRDYSGNDVDAVMNRVEKK
jgi:hypothetical protein